MKILVPLAPGFEEMEAITIIDLLRRAELNIVTAAISENPVKGSHNIKITADTILNEKDKYDAIILPGGMPGTNNLKDDKRIISLIKSINKSGGITAAICAAPIVLAEAGVLFGKKYTCYPGFENQIKDAFYTSDPVVQDSNIITSRSAGTAIPFALKLIEVLANKASSSEIEKSIMCPY